jgi:hypothetical protein
MMSADRRARRRGAGPAPEPNALDLELENIALRSELAALLAVLDAPTIQGLLGGQEAVDRVRARLSGGSSRAATKPAVRG